METRERERQIDTSYINIAFTLYTKTPQKFSSTLEFHIQMNGHKFNFTSINYHSLKVALKYHNFFHSLITMPNGKYTMNVHNMPHCTVCEACLKHSMPVSCLWKNTHIQVISASTEHRNSHDMPHTTHSLI